ncbi:MAG: hypothetical protein IJF59_02465 [Clostridia bacterium]|nr:hypothetical protein [Clostridia bacterium]
MMSIRKYHHAAALLALLLMLLTLAACSTTKSDETYATIEELGDELGYFVNSPAYLPGKGYTTTYRALDNAAAEIVYESDEQTVTFRMAMTEQELLGDVSEYPETYESTCRGYVVPLHGKDGVAYAAQWNENGKTFALRFEVGITPELFDEVIKGV